MISTRESEVMWMMCQVMTHVSRTSDAGDGVDSHARGQGVMGSLSNCPKMWWHKMYRVPAVTWYEYNHAFERATRLEATRRALERSSNTTSRGCWMRDRALSLRLTHDAARSL